MNKFSRFISAFAVFLISLTSFGQESLMATEMRSNGKIYVVVAVLLTIFIGLILFLITIERRVKRLEKNQKEG